MPKIDSLALSEALPIPEAMRPGNKNNYDWADLSLVNDLARLTIGAKEKNFYSL